mmetsp:Transcript_121613/g.351050  ORF Transcript_121613/g.351050 Transcript_121613/m.351050 type:complete len:92 (-) Transcript_121613:52-327(-)|eukprot:CAMPEP_0176082804 /NCGR_PEP_ID=MMETSP0120_2-20121206/41422_1 /TAXON_ID=160619 /ORGANISM="Kryptoperidinium foliaceum, Strain CCMP 1326" /LENGTH=91 /DNA_ID=CAMNT_0017416577 /DNA_START=40 /DNA_END=315 /DNA_ORIENTATION=-
MDHLDSGYVGLERALMVNAKTLDRLVKDHTEAKKKMDDKSVENDKKTFLKAQIPKMEAEIKDVKKKLADILESEELDPRGEYYLLAEKLLK